MVNLWDLSDDIHSLLFALLNPPDMRAMASSSQEGFQLASRALVRTVKLSRDPQQVLSFCEFALRHHLCSHIINFTLSESAIYSQPPKDWRQGYLRYSDVAECALFTGALAEVLEGAIHLTHLAFQDCTDVLLKSEPRIANIICHRPPAFSLELSGADTASFQMFSSVAGLAHLKLHTVNPPKYDRDAEEALDTILGNSIHTLETLSLGHGLAANLRSEHSSSLSWERVHHLSMPGVPLFPAQLARPFPNLKSLEIMHSLWPIEYVWTTPTPWLNFQVDCPSHTLWPALHSFSGPQQLALNLSQYHRLRRISFMLWDVYFDSTSLAQLSKTLRNSDVCSLSLKLALVEEPEPTRHWLWTTDTAILQDDIVNSMDPPPPFLDRLLSALALSANCLTYLSLHMGSHSSEIPVCLKHLHTAASLLAPLIHLKYVELGVMTWLGPLPVPPFVPITISMKPEKLVRAWADGIPSLQYLELNVVTVHEEWKHSWWRIEFQGSYPRTVRRVSEEEGLSAKVWFDLEEWK